MLRKDEELVLDFIFNLNQKNMSPRVILLKLFKFYLTSDPTSFSQKPNNDLVIKLLALLKDTEVTDETAIKNMLAKLVVEHDSQGIPHDPNFFAILNGFLSVYQHYIFVLTTYNHSKSTAPLQTKLKTAKNIWMHKYPHTLKYYKKNIHSFAQTRLQVCNDLALLKDCINLETRKTIVADLISRIHSDNHYTRKHSYESLCVLNEFIPEEQGPVIVKTIINSFSNEHEKVLQEACRTLGRLARYIPVDQRSIVYDYLLAKLKYCHGLPFKLVIVETMALCIRNNPDENLIKDFFAHTKYLLTTDDTDTLDIVCGVFVALRKLIPADAKDLIIHDLLDLFDTTQTRKYACETLAKLADIVPADTCPLILNKLFTHIFDTDIHKNVTQAIIAFQKYIDKAAFNKEIQALIDGLCDQEFEDESFIISLLAQLSPCMIETHRKQFTNEILIRLHDSNIFSRIGCCKALGSMADTMPEFFIPSIIDKLLFIFKTQGYLRKTICFTLGKLHKHISPEKLAEFITLLLNHLRYDNGSFSALICETLPTFIHDKTPMHLQQNVILKLCRLLNFDDLKNIACKTLLDLIPKFSSDALILLLGKVADKNTELADKIFIYANHERSQRITSQHREVQLYFCTHVRDVAQYTRQFGI